MVLMMKRTGPEIVLCEERIDGWDEVLLITIVCCGLQLVALHEVHDRPSFANAQAAPVAHVQQSLVSSVNQERHAAATSTSSEYSVGKMGLYV